MPSFNVTSKAVAERESGAEQRNAADRSPLNKFISSPRVQTWTRDTFLSKSRETLIVIAVLALITSAVFGPVIWHFNDWLYGSGGDGLSVPIGIIQRKNSLERGALFTPLPTLLGAPFRHDGEGLFTIEPLWWYPGVALSYLLTPIGAGNALLLLSFLATGLSLYYLLRHNGIPCMSAFIGATVYTYSPIRLAEAQQHFAFLSGFIFAIESYLLLRIANDKNAHRPGQLGLCLAAAFMLNPYLGYFAVLLAAAWIGSVETMYIVRRRMIRPGELVIRYTFDVIVLTAIIVMVEAPLFVRLYVQNDPTVAQLFRPMSDANDLSLRWWHFFLPDPDNPIARLALAHSSLNYGRAEHSIDQSVTVGITALFVASAGAWYTLSGWQRRSSGADMHNTHLPSVETMSSWKTLGSLGLTSIIVGLLCGMPPQVEAFGRNVSTPSYVFVRFLPEIRTLSRADLIIQWGVALLAAIGCAAVASRLRRKWVSSIIAFAVCLAIAIEYVDFPPWHYVPLLPPLPVASWLAQMPDHRTGIVAQYPLESDTYEVTSLYSFAAYGVHHHRLLNGTISGTAADGLRRNLHDVLNPTLAGSLSALGVKTVTIDHRFYDVLFGNAGLRWVDYGDISGRNYPFGLKEVYADGASSGFEVVANPASAIVGLGDGFGSPELRSDGREWSWIGASARIWLYGPSGHPVPSVVWARVHNNHGPHRVGVPEYEAAVVPESDDSVPVAFPIEVQPGFSQTALNVEGEAAPIGSERRPVSVEVRSLEPAPVVPLDARFIEEGVGRWNLTGMSLDACAVKAGTSVNIALLWQVIEPTRLPQTVFVHLLRLDDGALVAQDDGVPNRGGSPTSSTTRGALVPDVHTVAIPTNATPGEYRLEAGLYNRLTGARLRIANGTDRLDLGSISVLPKEDKLRQAPCAW